MPYCSNCGRRIYADDNFCSGCGRPVSQVAASSLSSSTSYTPAVTEGRGRASSGNLTSSAPKTGTPSWSQPPQQPSADDARRGKLALVITFAIVIIVTVIILGTIGAMLDNFF